MMSISEEAAEARDSLSDDNEIVNTYEVKLSLSINFGSNLRNNDILCHVICNFFPPALSVSFTLEVNCS